jgi:hypothetical protein
MNKTRKILKGCGKIKTRPSGMSNKNWEKLETKRTKAREYSMKAYYRKKGNTTIKLSNQPEILSGENTEPETRPRNTTSKKAPTPKAPTPKAPTPNNRTLKKSKYQSYNANNELNNNRSNSNTSKSVNTNNPKEHLECETTIYDMDLTPYFEQVKRNHPKFLKATVHGEACELWAIDNLHCRQCGSKNWKQMPRNHPGFDLSCMNCNTKCQIKSLATSNHIKTRKDRCEISGATYAAVSKCHKEFNIDYFLFDIDETEIKHIYYVNHQTICCKTDMKKRIVTKQENIKAGRNGREYCSFNLDTNLCEKIFPVMTIKQ